VICPLSLCQGRLREIEALEKVAERDRLSVVVGEGGLAGHVVTLV
jgi:hypothetical protein